MVAACISGIVAAAFVPAFAVLNAFNPKVHSTLKGYSGGTTNLRLILQVRLLKLALSLPRLTIEFF